MDFNSYYLLYMLAGAILGATINLTGVGGGVLVIPVLSVMFGLEPAAAVGTASLYAALTKIFASYQHIKLGNIVFKEMGAFLIGSITFSLLVAIILNTLINTGSIEQALLIEKGQLYFIFFVILFSVIITALDIYFQEFKKQKQKTSKQNNFFLIILSGCFVGVVMGATGIGGGILIIPSLLYSTQLSIQKIVGISIVSASIISIVTSLAYADGGQVNYIAALMMTIGSFVAIPFASKMMKFIPVLTLKILILILIIFSGFLMILR